ncbi:hypothetical protein AGR2A_Lc150111 [Agrobacterium genomosp. 2 str. CFBP 5494]|uniref:Uncharacterized protein n=1 Tax=Agrobacterium genomosp. 2 str. CFBP 5494 TaxID=1183436 RepID=A0A9W5F3P2_9HYPH|nr:hypothetical protein AGR2A_Lc150111 [Agrobacterium genomosp. 2 str. CFBP 5494]
MDDPGLGREVDRSDGVVGLP